MATAGRRSEHRWMALASVGIAQTMVALDSTIVNIALPSAQDDLGFGDDQRQWVVTAYALAFGSLLLLGGRLSDLLGRRRAFFLGLIGFAAASALGGFAGDFTFLVTARALQGLFAALLAPSALALLTTTFTDARERARAFGVFSALAGGGGAIGLLLGGVLTQYSTWRACLLVNIVIAAVAITGAAFFVAPTPRLGNRHIDYLGTLTVTGGLFAIVYGLSLAELDGWNRAAPYGCLAAGLILLSVFVLLQRRVRNPLLPLRILLDRTRGGAYLALAIISVAVFGVSLFLTYYMQQTLRLTSLTTGIAFLPMPVAIVTAATVVGARLMPRIGPRVQATLGGLIATIGMAGFTLLGPNPTSYWAVVLPGLLILGFGVGLIFSSTFSAATSGVRPEDAGVASAAVSTMQQVGGAVGTALLSSIYTTVVLRALTSPATETGIANATLAGYHAAFAASAAACLLLAVITWTIIPTRTRLQLNPTPDLATALR